MIDLAKKCPEHAAAASLSNALGNPRGTVYDTSTGRVTSTSDAKGNSTSQTYDALGRVKTVTDRTGKVTTNTYDNAGRLETITDAENRITTYGYDLKGQRTSTTLADNSARASVYDAAGRVIEMLYPSGKSRKNFYAFSGVMDKVEYRNAAGGLTGTDTFGYDDFLRRTSSNSRYGVANVMQYDYRGLMVSNTTTYAGKSYPVGYQYDDRGRLEEITYPSGRKVNYTFEERSLLDTIAWTGQEIEDRNYNELGLLTEITRAGSAVDEARSYDNLNRVTSIANTNVGTGSYSYDANGNKLSESWSGAMSAWNFTTQSGSSDGYDDEDRFVNFIQPTKNKTVSFTRSNIGNISNVNLNGTNTNRGYSNIHELSSIGSSSQSFDDDGNLTQSHTGIDLNWDEGGMLKQTIVGSGDTTGIEGTNEYGYDADGKRAWKKITRGGSVAEHVIYIYAGPNCIAEYNSGANANSPSQEYVYAQAIDSLVMLVRNGGSQKLTVTRNQQWSITALSNSSNGSVVERYTYDEFGKRTILAPNGSTVRASSNYNNPYGYTSRRHNSESGLMYFRARYYDPTTGEFTSQDPLEYVDGMSLYRGYFVPNGVDPWGLMSGDCDKSVGISFSNDWKTGTASAYIYWGTDCHVKLDPRKPDWDGALQKIKSCLGDCCINSIVFTSHGHPGGFGPFGSGNVTNSKSDESKFLAGLKGLLCEDNGGCRINACNVAKHDVGKKFICDFAEGLGTNVIAWDDWYAVVPHGKEFTACPDGTFDETGDTCREFEGSWIQWLNGGGPFGGKTPKPGDGKPGNENGKKGKGGKQGCCKVNQKGCCGLKDGQGKDGNKPPKNK